MTKMEAEVRRVGATFAVASKEDLEFVKSLGELGTKSTTAKQQLREYTDAIASLTATFRAMTDEEKNSDTGKALSASIDQLKAKAAELKDIMSDTNREIQNLASDTSFTDGLNLMTRTVGSCAAAITAWTGDSKEMEQVVKDLAKIGTTVAAVDQLTKAFQKQNLVLLKNPYVAAAAAVVALGVAIGKLIKKSQELDAVQKAINDVQQKGRENSAQEATRIQSLNDILHDNTRSLEERKSALSQIQQLVPDYHGALTEEGTLINDNTGAIDDYIVSLQRAATAQAAFDRMVEIQKQKMEEQLKLEKAQKELESARSMQSASVPNGAAAFGGGGGMSINTAVAGTNTMAVKGAESTVNKIQGKIDELDAQSKALQALIKADDISTDAGKTKTKGGGTTTTTAANDPVAGSIAAQEKKVADLTKKWKEAADDPSRQTIKAELEEANRVLEEMKGNVESSSVTTAADMWQDYTDKLKEVKDRLAEFQAMVKDTSLSDAQRDWAQGMADSYQEQLDKMTGATEEAVEEMTDKLQDIPSSFEMFKDGVGAVGSLVGAMDNLKSIGEDLASAFSGEMDAWDSLMTVLNSGIGIMETVISVIEAINTLTEIGSALKAKNAIAATTEASAVVAGKGTEAAATTSEMAVEATATGVTAGKAAASAGDAVAGIPIVGPVLAVAAVAAVLAAILASVSKAKSSAGNYAVGGIVPGSSFSGDNLTANVNSGELILNRAQQGAIAGQLNSNPMGNLRLSTEISGTNLRIVMNNDNRARGGQRGFYSEIH